ncbi:MAG: cyclic di-GMP phosphodiesterase [Frankiaceae bacterium]|nr:cyclic di-GMP phosphodiesterase [Frankiaceae bacterium]
MDDEDGIRRTVSRVLKKHGHTVEEAADVEFGRQQLALNAFDLVLCDIGMPGESGLVLVRQIAAQLPDTAVVMITGEDDPAIAAEALSMGACGYLVKPFRPNELAISVAAALRLRDLERARRGYLKELEEKVVSRTAALHRAIAQLEDTESTTGAAISEAADRLVIALTLRSEETGSHIQRMSRYASRLAVLAGIEAPTPEQLRVAMMLHDVGKIGVPDWILLKPGPLDAQERVVMERHPQMGAAILAGGQSTVLALASRIAVTHHERWDGSGYPTGLAGESIPVEGRIAAIADVFDALTSDRVYRQAMSIDDAVTVMEAERGRHFDPHLLDLFLGALDQLLAIREAHAELRPEVAPCTVLVVVPARMVADSVVRMLASLDDVSVIGVAADGAGALAAARGRTVDVIIAAAPRGRPQEEGFQLVQSLHGASPASSVVLLVDVADDLCLLGVLEAGGAGIVQYDRAFDDLRPAVLTLGAGQSLVPACKLFALFKLRETAPRAAVVELTPRELEVLRLMAEGLSNQSIADRLTLSLNTVRNHVQRTLGKLSSHSKLEAVAAAGRKGLLPPT